MLLVLLPVCLGASPATDSIYKKADTYFKQGNYALFLEAGLNALELSEKGSCPDKALAYLQVGRAYYFLQQKDMAVRYFRMVANLPAACDIDSFRRTGYRFLGAVYAEKSKRDSAMHWLKLSEQLLVKTNSYRELSGLYAIMGELDVKATKSRKYFDLAMENAIKSGDTAQMAFANVKLGVYDVYNNNCRKAEGYFRKALELYRRSGLAEGEIYGLRMLAWSMNECGHPKDVYVLMDRMQQLRDSIFKAATAEQTAQYRTMYETEKKERENAELARQNSLKETELATEGKNRRLLVAGFVIVLLAMLVAFVSIYWRYRLKQQKNADRRMAEQQELHFAAVIEAEENERRRIAGDLHDGLGQMMSAAKINLSRMQGELSFTDGEQRAAFDKITSLVDECCREVRMVSHNMMPNTLLKSGLANGVRNFINQIDHRVLHVDFYSEGLDSPMNSNNEVVLYRVIQECVNNVIKHSGGDKLFLSLIKDEEGIAITIEDNGKGFDKTGMEKFEGLGLKNVQSRISYLKGTVEWHTAPGKGTAVVINVPVVNTGINV